MRQSLSLLYNVMDTLWAPKSKFQQSEPTGGQASSSSLITWCHWVTYARTINYSQEGFLALSLLTILLIHIFICYLTFSIVQKHCVSKGKEGFGLCSHGVQSITEVQSIQMEGRVWCMAGKCYSRAQSTSRVMVNMDCQVTRFRIIWEKGLSLGIWMRII